MSQFNQTNPPPPSPNAPGKKNNSIIYWVVILVLLAGCLYLFMSKNKMAEDNNNELKQKQQQIDSVKTDRAALQSDFDAASAKIDQLVSQNTKLDSALQGNKAEMMKLQSRIRSILGNSNATKAELREAREMIANLNDKSKQYEARIAELEHKNTVLTGENKVLTKERDSTVETNIALKKVGSVLHASNIRMEPIHVKRNGKEKETSKAKKVNELRITFDIDENRIAESGNKDIYIRIIGPDGNVLSSPSNASGSMTTINGNAVLYSVMKDIPLIQNQPVKDIVIDWHQDGDYKKGTYAIEIYSEGYKVGNDKVDLK
jgi:peptidoglycan hydrolase CwlO-like protein